MGNEYRETYRDTDVIGDNTLFTLLNTWHTVRVVWVVLVEPLIHEYLSIKLEQVTASSIFDPSSSVVNPARLAFVVRVTELPRSVTVAVWVPLSDLRVKLGVVSTPLSGCRETGRCEGGGESYIDTE